MKNLVVIVLAIVVIIFTSCEKEEISEMTIDNGIYFGLFNENAVAYKVNNNIIQALGYSFEQISTVIVNQESFVANYPNDYNPQSALCFKTTLKEGDYENAVINSDKEFYGLHYAHNRQDISLGGGAMIFAIKSLANGNVQITITKLGQSFRYQTEGKITMSNDEIPHRKLTFKVTPDITNGEIEEWTMTLNSVSSYQWSNLFSLYTNNVNRFQIEVIDNGMK